MEGTNLQRLRRGPGGSSLTSSVHGIPGGGQPTPTEVPDEAAENDALGWEAAWIDLGGEG
jgi:hypothetical protein